ncbi:MAG: lipoprotein-releasing ABC transporter permease subunit [Magnetococcales bacterium]|nr:lipoprotein-releasing ABC transporter permease subunit [Magnetococcales bacterium]
MGLYRYEWLIGVRYLRAKHTQHFMSVMTFFSTGGITIGVAALIVVLAVMTGFQDELRRQILGVTSDVVVQSVSASGMKEYRQILAEATQTPRVTAAAPFILKQAMLLSGGKANGVVMRGVLPELESGVSALANNLTDGSLSELKGFGIIIGKRLASSLGVGMGDGITVVAPTGNVTAMGTLPRTKRFHVAGIFDSGMYEYDHTLAYIHLHDAQLFFRYEDDSVTGVEIRVEHPDLAFGVRGELQKRLLHLPSLMIQDWMQMNRNFFRALQIEKATMAVILSLVVLVAAFNIISSLVMLVMEKGRDIAILKTMGATSRSVMAIFIINGGITGLVGTGIGVVLGVALAANLESVLAWIEQNFGIKILSGEVYFIDHLPAVIRPTDVIWIACASLVISLLATIYPAWRASRVDPVEALRYE